ncbi:replication protein [Rhizobium phage RHph_Y67]|nr:replication protein [Rhizobium phage RHph_Y67]
MQFRPLSEVSRLASKALQAGAAHPQPTSVQWNLDAWCEDPKTITVVGRGYLKGFYQKKTVASVNPGHLSVELSGLPCRRCPKCLRIRALQWSERAMNEIASSQRTWWCTLTMNPHWQHRVFMEELAQKTAVNPRRPGKGGWLDSDFNDEAKEFLLRCQGGLKLCTKFWKNVRNPKKGEEPVRLKYLLVAERHVSGLPHYHALVHEQAGSITYRRLSGRWLRYGFFHGKLVGMDDLSPEKAASYLTKYVAKDMLCRVRASERYGLQPAQISSQIEDLDDLCDWLGVSPSLSLP